MKTRLLGAMALFLILLATVSAATLTITFNNRTPAYTVSGHRVTAVITGDANAYAVATATQRYNSQRLIVDIHLSSPIAIRDIAIDYYIDIDNPNTRYEGGIWDVTVRNGGVDGNWTYAGTIGTRLINDAAWRTASTVNTEMYGAWWQADKPYIGDYIRLQLKAAATQHSGLELRLDNIVINS